MTMYGHFWPCMVIFGHGSPRKNFSLQKCLCGRRTMGIPSLSRVYSFRIGTSGLWSTTSSKCFSPSRNWRHFCIAQAALRHFNSIMAYRDWVPERNRDPAWTIIHWLAFFCFRRIPSQRSVTHPLANPLGGPGRKRPDLFLGEGSFCSPECLFPGRGPFPYILLLQQRGEGTQDGWQLIRKITNLLAGAEECPHVCHVFRGWETANGFRQFRVWLEVVFCDPESSEFHRLLGKHLFFYV